jgi:hypothetical protein
VREGALQATLPRVSLHRRVCIGRESGALNRLSLFHFVSMSRVRRMIGSGEVMAACAGTTIIVLAQKRTAFLTQHTQTNLGAASPQDTLGFVSPRSGMSKCCSERIPWRSRESRHHPIREVHAPAEAAERRARKEKGTIALTIALLAELVLAAGVDCPQSADEELY